MSVDPNNEVVKLCAAGIEAEMAGRHEEARLIYGEAWERRSNDYESCIVAHYVARIQTSPQELLHWNKQALTYADKVGDSSVQSFYPSLYLNVAKAYEDMGDRATAQEYYQLGAEKCSMLPDDQLGNMTRDAIRRGLERVG